MAQAQVKVPYLENYDFGVGVDLASGSPMGKVVEGEISGVTDAGGAQTVFHIDRLHTTSDLETALGIDVEASGGCGLFGASARMNYAKKTKVQSSSLFMGITAYVVLENLSIDDPAMVAKAKEIAGRDDVFHTRYGNMFVRGVSRGGLFVGVMQIDTTSSEESESLSAQLGGSYGLFSAKAKMNFEEVQKNFHAETHITVYHEGGPIDLTMNDITDANQLYVMLQQWLKAFQDNPKANAVPYSVTLAPIAIADGPIPPNAAQIEHAQDVLVICAKQRSQMLDAMNLMDFISQHPARYEFTAPTTVADVVSSFDGYQYDLDVVAAAASHAINDVAGAVTPAEFAAKNGKSFPHGLPPSPMPTMAKGMMDVLAAKGESVTNADPLAVALAATFPDGAARRGFYIGMAAAEGQTLPGPGKDKIRDGLPPEQQPGYAAAVAFSLERNANIENADKGAKIVAVDPEVAAARKHPSPLFSLGFDIATGIFGDPALGALGNTLTGPGSLAIRETLSADGKRGFDAAVRLMLGPPLRPRRA
ncbi:hypothetical protein [Solirubrobacter soli]|uniref:hypothetical protein n=1 Tax=Solirubrobacter soli TaxID=363832 RepID=UPI0012FB7F9C|nr:hypothetical protein [Solirubrobacter soli]